MKLLKNLAGIFGILSASLIPLKNLGQEIKSAGKGDESTTTIGYFYDDRWDMDIEGIVSPEEIKIGSAYVLKSKKMIKYGQDSAVIYRGAKISILDTLGSNYDLDCIFRQYDAKIKVLKNKNNEGAAE